MLKNFFLQETSDVLIIFQTQQHLGLIQTLSVISLKEDMQMNKITSNKTVKVSAVESAFCTEPVKNAR